MSEWKLPRTRWYCGMNLLYTTHSTYVFYQRIILIARHLIIYVLTSHSSYILSVSINKSTKSSYICFNNHRKSCTWSPYKFCSADPHSYIFRCKLKQVYEMWNYSRIFGLEIKYNGINFFSLTQNLMLRVIIRCLIVVWRVILVIL